MSSPKVSLVLSGGVALGAYEAGAYAALHAHDDLRPAHVAASSVGAVNAALIAGNAPDRRIAQLQAFWEEAQLDLTFPGALPEGPWRHAANWLSVMHTRLFGRTGQFRPRIPELVPAGTPSLYELAPLRVQIERYVDFERVNRGEPRLSVMTTDIESGEAVVFDTAAGARIGAEHLVASCGFLPDFPPLEIGGRLLGDGGLSANAPVEVALADEPPEGDRICFVVDLFSSRGARPKSIEQAAARRWDLLFGNQTRNAIRRLAREPRLGHVKLVHLAYRAPPHEAGPEKPFDFSRHSLAERWEAGRRDMEEAVALLRGAPASDAGAVTLSAW